LTESVSSSFSISSHSWEPSVVAGTEKSAENEGPKSPESSLLDDSPATVDATDAISIESLLFAATWIWMKEGGVQHSNIRRSALAFSSGSSSCATGGITCAEMAADEDGPPTLSQASSKLLDDDDDAAAASAPVDARRGSFALGATTSAG
ncbi:hypothetical protein PENTCL1PPCAC_30109, partial [Pristionchus entomophagus]